MKPASALAYLLLSATVSIAFSQDFSQTGKPPSRSKIEALLPSQGPRIVAWEAHFALVSRDQSMVPALVSLADSWQQVAGTAAEEDNISAEQFERRDAMAAVLDALIQMNVSVPVGTLRTLAADFPNYVAILLSRLPLGESQELSWEFYHAEPHSLGADDLQYVSAKLLAEAPPPGFAADLLSSIHVETTIFIDRPGKPVREYGRCGGGFGCGPPGSRKGWPEFGVYVLSENKIAGGFVIVSEEHPVYAFRQESTHYAGDRCETFTFAILGPEERRELIAQMLDVAPDDIEWGATIRKTLVFQSEPQFYHDLLGYIASQQEEYGATARALVAKNLMLAAEEEESLPRIDLRFVDQPGPGFAPLQRPALLPAHLTWPEMRQDDNGAVLAGEAAP